MCSSTVQTAFIILAPAGSYIILCLVVPGLDECHSAPELLNTIVRWSVVFQGQCDPNGLGVWQHCLTWTIIWIWQWRNKETMRLFVAFLTAKRRAEVWVHFFNQSLFMNMAKFQTSEQLNQKQTKSDTNTWNPSTSWACCVVFPSTPPTV